MTVQKPAEGLFLPGPAGALFVRYYPVDGTSHRADVVVVPPFAEEMNKSRRMFALLAARFNAIGVGTVVFDLFGTGDSEGDFSDARYDIWIEDLATVLRWLRARSAVPTSLVGLRFGGLLAADAVRRGAFPIERLVLWQPVLSGEAMMTQFLRLRVAAGMTSSANERETTTALRERLRAGKVLEIAGYTLAPALVAAIDALQLESFGLAGFPPVEWLELGSNAPAPASRRIVERWQSRGIAVGMAQLPGAPFWNAVEIATAPELIEHTVRVVEGRAAA